MLRLLEVKSRSFIVGCMEVLVSRSTLGYRQFNESFVGFAKIQRGSFHAAQNFQLCE